MSDDDYEKSLLTPDEIDALLLADFEWLLNDGVLICLGYKPSLYNWKDHGGNDLPVRLRAACRKEIRRGNLVAYEVNGRLVVERDDLIPLCYKILQASCEKTYQIWLAYKAKRAARKAPSTQMISNLEHEMDTAIQAALLQEYRENQEKYDEGRKRLVKERLYDRILKNHPAWTNQQRSALRRSGKKFNIEWAKLRAKS